MGSKLQSHSRPETTTEKLDELEKLIKSNHAELMAAVWSLADQVNVLHRLTALQAKHAQNGQN